MRVNGNRSFFQAADSGFFRQSPLLSRLFGQKKARSGTLGPGADGIAYQRENSGAPRLYTAKGMFVGTRTKKRPHRSVEGSSEREILGQMNKWAYMEWENAALTEKISLTARLFPRKKEETGFPDDPLSAREKDAEGGRAGDSQTGDGKGSRLRFGKPMPVGAQMKQPSEQWALKTSSKGVLEQMHKGAFLYRADGRSFYVQGQGEDGEPDEKKYCSVKELRDTLGYQNPKTLRAKENRAVFDEDSLYAFTGSDQKKHNVLSIGGVLMPDLLDYARFWSSLAHGNERDVLRRYRPEEIRTRLAEAGIHNGPFTVTVGSRSMTYELAEEPKKDPAKDSDPGSDPERKTPLLRRRVQHGGRP